MKRYGRGSQSCPVKRPFLPFVAGLAMWAVGCASDTAPSQPVTQVAGAWVANATLSGVVGGECVGDTLRQIVPGSGRDIDLTALKQDGNTLSATVTSQGHGTVCAYTGSRIGDAVSLTMSSCQTGRITAIRCGNGSLRDAQLASGTINATLGGRTTGSGTDTTIWNIYASGGSGPVATLTVTAAETWTFLGIPSSDYHVFTGTVFPGYADGTISIEGVDTFCAPCGWFPR